MDSYYSKYLKYKKKYLNLKKMIGGFGCGEDPDWDHKYFSRENSHKWTPKVFEISDIYCALTLKNPEKYLENYCPRKVEDNGAWKGKRDCEYSSINSTKKSLDPYFKNAEFYKTHWCILGFYSKNLDPKIKDKTLSKIWLGKWQKDLEFIGTKIFDINITNNDLLKEENLNINKNPLDYAFYGYINEKGFEYIKRVAREAEVERTKKSIFAKIGDSFDKMVDRFKK
jgi:hypothetical protein